MYYTEPELKGKVGLPKCRMYAVGIFDANSDLEHMLIAYGPEQVQKMISIAKAKLDKREAAICNAANKTKPRHRIRVKAGRAA